MLKGVSLFANVGIAEAYFKEIGVDIVLANEIDEKSMEIVSYNQPYRILFLDGLFGWR